MQIHFDTKHQISQKDKDYIAEHLPDEEKTVLCDEPDCQDWLRLIKEYNHYYVVQNLGRKKTTSVVHSE
jgi:hypothetical protein